jgi:uncharacterized protein (DUF927 family)
MNVPIVPIGLIKTAFESEHIPALLKGQQTHDPALRLVAQIVKHADDDNTALIVKAALPPNYGGDSLKELPGMIAGARQKGLDKPDDDMEIGFNMKSDGLYFTSLKAKTLVTEFISGPFEVAGLVRDPKGSGWARVMHWRDLDGTAHEYIASDRDLLNEHDIATGDMISQGLRIGKGKQIKLAEYILAQTPPKRVTKVNETGWHSIKGASIFALPSQIIGDVSEEVVYDGAHQDRSEFVAQGTLDDWKKFVSEPAGGHVLGVLAISASLAAPLLKPAEQEGGGLHFFGSSSTGKTTLLRLAASVWGDGGMVRSWRATSNGLEAIANRANDVALILDELGQVDSKEAAAAVYMLATGIGKVRMTRNASLKDIKTWRVAILSSGEMTIETKILQTRGTQAFTGVTLRLLNVAADREAGHGAFDNAGPTGNAADMVKEFAAAANRCHGVAGPEFVRALIAQDDVGGRIRSVVTSFVQANVTPGSDGQIERAAKRFGLIAAAGEQATTLGITGWEDGVATRAASATFALWKEARGGDGKEPAEDRRAVMHIRRMIAKYGESRFAPLNEKGFPMDDKEYSRATQLRYGWRKYEGEKQIWMIDDAMWEELCEGFEPKQVSKALARVGALKIAGDRLTCAETFEGKRNKRFRVITAKILNVYPEEQSDDDVAEEPDEPSPF